MRFLVAAAMAVALLAGTAGAVTMLSNGNSVAVIDSSSQGGMSSWVVDGQNYLFQQWFWYRVGETGGEQSIDTLGLVDQSAFGRILETTGRNDQIEVQITYVLAGGSLGSGRSDIGESIKLTNLTNQTQTVHFFQYSDFDLGNLGANTGVFVNTNKVRQTGDTVVLQETTVGPPDPNHRQLGIFPSLLNQLNDGSPTTLADTPLGAALTGDVTWAYQWDFVLAPGASAVISKDKGILPVPEPLTVLGLLASAGGIGAYIRRRQVA